MIRPLRALLAVSCMAGAVHAANTSDAQRVGTTVQTPSPVRGDPVVITWSIVPDDLAMPATFTDPANNPNPVSDLVASLDDDFAVPAGDRDPAGRLRVRGLFCMLKHGHLTGHHAA